VPSHSSPAFYDFLIRQSQVAGFSPNIVQIGGDVVTILGLVAAGIGYSIVPDTALHSHPAGTRLVEHPELTMSYPVEIVWRRDQDNVIENDALTHTRTADATRRRGVDQRECAAIGYDLNRRKGLATRRFSR